MLKTLWIEMWIELSTFLSDLSLEFSNALSTLFFKYLQGLKSFDRVFHTPTTTTSYLYIRVIDNTGSIKDENRD
jgi:hypothetical protein